MPDLGDYVTTDEAAQLSGYKQRWLAQLVREGKLEAVKVGRTWLIHKEKLLAYVEEMKQLGPSKHDPTRGKQ